MNRVKISPRNGELGYHLRMGNGYITRYWEVIAKKDIITQKWGRGYHQELGNGHVSRKLTKKLGMMISQGSEGLRYHQEMRIGGSAQGKREWG